MAQFQEDFEIILESKDGKVFQKLPKGNVLYIDVHVGFEKPERLRKLGISRAAI